MRPSDKKTIPYIKKKKSEGGITALTAYDYPTARILSDAGIDIILVGDSLGMVLQGNSDTLSVTMEQMIYHTSMVSASAPTSIIVADMPFGSYHSDVKSAVTNAVRLIKEGGAEAVKLEGGRKRFEVLKGIINCDIPVLGHLGLTPQSVHYTGGFKVQGKIRAKAEEIIEDALELEKLGVFGIVLESVPVELAEKITKLIKIPTIGIGAGHVCDGQILVFHDLVGFTNLYLPRFVKKYADVYTNAKNAVEKYKEDIKSRKFPGKDESYYLKKDIDEFLNEDSKKN